MPIFRWTPRPGGFRVPWRELERLRSHLEGMYEAVTEGVDAVRHGAGVYPLINLSEDDANLYLTAELPGVTPDEIELSVQGGQLSLRGERKIPALEAQVNYHRREREAGFFRRVVSLPAKVDPDQVQAAVKDGLLKVTLPKAPESRKRQIAVKPE
ncbi:MAG: Hsp20/alpha crystallin family protein [Thermodesulfobacteriota bacterium]